MIVSCGEALVDLVPDPVPGGGPMNVAVAAARLGAPAAFIGRISTDHHGRQVWQYLLDNGVLLAGAERSDEPTARAIVEHVPELRFRFEGLGTADQNLSAANLDALGAGPHIVHGGTLGLFRGRTAEVLATLAESHVGIVSLDPNVRPQIIDDRERWLHFHDRWISNVSIYRGSDEDLDWIWPGRSIESIAEQLLAGRCHAVVMTKGPDGAVGYAASGQVTVPGRPVDVVDTVGAGDTFTAAMLVWFWEHGLAGAPTALGELTPTDWVEVLSFAIDAAAVTVGRKGADPPTRNELR